MVGVHLNVALDSFDAEPDEARDALRLAQDVRGRAMTDLKALVDVLRDGSPIEPAGGAGRPGPAGRRRSARPGWTVTVTETGDRSAVPAPVATAVYRVVQESLTNTVRHAGATPGRRCCCATSPRRSQWRFATTAPGGGPVIDGHGIPGMRERVAALGGALTAGRGKAGFTVRATIPLAG